MSKPIVIGGGTDEYIPVVIGGGSEGITNYTGEFLISDSGSVGKHVGDIIERGYEI